jgi:two-component system, OmpR family, KDP operon response regulator KdpE
LLAHDEPAARFRLRRVLRAEGCEVDELCQSETPQDALRRRPFDLVLLGPGTAEAIETCRRVRNLAPRIAIVCAGGPESEEVRADMLDAGADDCITVSFESREFPARLRAALRRAKRSEPAGTLLREGDLELDVERRTLRQCGTPVHLTRREFDLLAMLMRKTGLPIPHSQLLRSVWGPDYGNELEYLRAYIRRLRKKLEGGKPGPGYLRTVPGIGYCFEAPSGSSRD